MSADKQKLIDARIDEGWEVVKLDDQNLDWWCDEYWEIRSIRENFGVKLLIFFLVDPQWDGQRKKGQGSWAITATSKFPENRLGTRHEIALLPLAKRKFDAKLQEFILSLTEYRRKLQSKS
jgi:hypothetical protein